MAVVAVAAVVATITVTIVAADVNGVAAPGPTEGLGGCHASDTDAEDARTLSITRDIEGVRYNPFRDAAKQCRQVEFPDWPITGPRTSRWVRSISSASWEALRWLIIRLGEATASSSHRMGSP